IDTSSTNKVVSPGVDGYFIRNSVLYLYRTWPNVDSRQVLTRDTSFVYDQNVWRSSITGASFLAGNLDLGSIVDKYLEAPENTNALNTLSKTGVTQQSVVVSNMVAYMSAYNAWANAGFPNNSLKSTAASIQVNMKNAVQAQYKSGGGTPGVDDFIPHPTPCPP